jgi:hypothetical protein
MFAAPEQVEDLPVFRCRGAGRRRQGSSKK